MLKIQKILVGAMAKLDEELVLSMVEQGLKMGVPPAVLLEEVRSGLVRVGEMYAQGAYFLADFIMAAEIFREVLLAVDHGEGVEPLNPFPPIIFGTVENDIHDIGKNITMGILNYNGFAVLDLGVNVPANVFVNAVKSNGSPVVCLTGLITNAYDSMKRTVELLDEAGLRPATTIIIGGLVNEKVRKFTGADYWSTDCGKVSELCREIFRMRYLERQVLTS
ncbi:MAG TPA: cobalamin-dependent protein [Patescibacteria group bacterium]|nr:cobalamin-dependent protein [Patescibacteria group bacterium]